MSHSPAPWNYRPCRCGHPNCNQYTISTQGSVGFDEDDARLIVAAPDLLEALVHAENALTDYVPTIEKSGASLNYGHHVLRQARAAIAKATGEKA